MWEWQARGHGPSNFELRLTRAVHRSAVQRMPKASASFEVTACSAALDFAAAQLQHLPAKKVHPILHLLAPASHRLWDQECGIKD